jgi:YD repeat-containing protein
MLTCTGARDAPQRECGWKRGVGVASASAWFHAKRLPFVRIIFEPAGCGCRQCSPLRSDRSRGKTTYSYDSMLRTTGTTVTTQGGTVLAQTARSYSGSSLPETITTTVTATPSPNEVSSTVLDGLGRISTQNLSSAAKVVTTYNLMGYVQSVSNPYLTTNDSTYGVTSYAYDGLGRKINQHQPDGSSVQSWAYSGNQLTFTDETGRAWKQFYDAFGRLTEVLEPDGSTNIGSAPTLETDYQYNALNDPTRVDQWGGPSGSSGDRVRTLQYDSLSRLTNACNPEAIAPGATCGTSGPWSAVYAYDPSSNLQSKTDANGATIQYSYDPVNRLQVQTNPSGTANACFWFDSSSVSSPPSGCPPPPAGLTTGSYLADRVSFEWTSDRKTGTGFGYDAMGRVSPKSVCTPSTCNTSAYGQLFQYDMAGNLISYSNGVGVTTSVAYDSAGRMSLVTSSLNDQNHPGTLWTASNYNAIGLTQAALGNGIVENKTYDKRQRAISDSIPRP